MNINDIQLAVEFAAFSVFGDATIPLNENLYTSYRADALDLWDMLEEVEYELNLEPDSLYDRLGSYNPDFQWNGTLQHIIDKLTQILEAQ